MAKKAPTKRSDPSRMSFEEAADELETIIERIESGKIGLEEALEERKRGEGLIKRCRAVLETAEQELKKLSMSGKGE